MPLTASLWASRLLATEGTGGEWPWQGGDLEAGAEEVGQSKTLFRAEVTLEYGLDTARPLGLEKMTRKRDQADE